MNTELLTPLLSLANKNSFAAAERKYLSEVTAQRGTGDGEGKRHDAALETKDCCQIGLGQAAGSMQL